MDELNFQNVTIFLTALAGFITIFVNWRRDVGNNRKADREAKLSETNAVVTQLTADYVRVRQERDNLEKVIGVMKEEHAQELKEKDEAHAAERAEWEKQTDVLKARLTEKDAVIANQAATLMRGANAPKE